MKGGSKIDGNHLEPIADRDYIARGRLVGYISFENFEIF